MRRTIGMLAFSALAGVAIGLVADQIAQAHHVDIDGETACVPGSTAWNANYAVYNPGPADWGVFITAEFSVHPGGDSRIVTFLNLTTDSHTLTVTGFFDKNGNGIWDRGDIDHSTSKTLYRPNVCTEVTTSTTTPDTSSTTTTTSPATTSSTTTTSTSPSTSVSPSSTSTSTPGGSTSTTDPATTTSSSVVPTSTSSPATSPPTDSTTTTTASSTTVPPVSSTTPPLGMLPATR